VLCAPQRGRRTGFTQASACGFTPVDAAVGVPVCALRDPPVIGHHDLRGASQVDEEYFTGDAAVGADIVVFTSDWSRSVSD